MNTRLFKLEIAQNQYKSIGLDLSSREFQRLDNSSETGSFLISVQDTTPYLDGYRVRLDIGNPWSATYRGFTISIEWNSAIKENTDTTKWFESMKRKGIPFTDSLNSGSWNKVELLLPATTAEQLGYCSISIKTNTISLSAR